jgi:hypothetical protein
VFALATSKIPLIGVGDGSNNFTYIAIFFFAVLYQEQQGKRKVIAYHSRKLNPAERNYPVRDRELLAIVEATTLSSGQVRPIKVLTYKWQLCTCKRSRD